MIHLFSLWLHLNWVWILILFLLGWLFNNVCFSYSPFSFWWLIFNLEAFERFIKNTLFWKFNLAWLILILDWALSLFVSCIVWIASCLVGFWRNLVSSLLLNRSSHRCILWCPSYWHCSGLFGRLSLSTQSSFLWFVCAYSISWTLIGKPF